MDQTEKVHRLTVMIAHSQLKLDAINKNTEGFLFARPWKNGLYILLEITLYTVFVFAFLMAVAIPSDPFTFLQKINEESGIIVKYHDDRITLLIYLVKFCLILLGSGFFLAALFSRKARKRGYMIKNTAKEIQAISNEMKSIAHTVSFH